MRWALEERPDGKDRERRGLVGMFHASEQVEKRGRATVSFSDS